MNDVQTRSLVSGDVLFLERPIAGIDWPTGYYVLHRLTQGIAVLSVLSQDAQGMCATSTTFTVSVEDLASFSVTRERARVPK